MAAYALRADAAAPEAEHLGDFPRRYRASRRRLANKLRVNDSHVLVGACHRARSADGQWTRCCVAQFSDNVTQFSDGIDDLSDVVAEFIDEPSCRAARPTLGESRPFPVVAAAAL
jgi:hypothetical protein